MSTAKTTKQQRKSGFRPGKSGNPNGRPHGSRNKATLALEALLEGEGEAITRKAVDMALQGEMAAIKLCMDRLVPVRKDAPVPFDMPTMTNASDSAAAMSGVLQALANGDITPGEASSVAGVIETYRRTLETTEIEDRIVLLEKARSS
jgi:hypothetical protein